MAIATEQNQGESNAALSNGLKLLITTQAVDLDDPILGFFHQWLALFARECESITVVCLREGRHQLPSNVRVVSLGKEHGGSRFLYLARFYRVIFRERTSYDAVFVHMNPEYVILGGFLWRAWGKRIGLWYTHKAVNVRLILATLFSNIVFSASKESFRFPTKKLRIMGHGIDTNLFAEAKHPSDLRIVTVGRITESKHLKEMLPVVDDLYGRGRALTMRFIGAPAGKRDISYERELRATVAARPFASSVSIGSVSNDTLPRTLADASVFLHMSTTGSVDKAVLEALATGLPVVTTSDAYPDAPVLKATGDARAIADTVERALAQGGAVGAGYVREHHSLDRLVHAIVESYARA